MKWPFGKKKEEPKKERPEKEEEPRCSNCGALVFKDILEKNQGMCGLCARDPEIAQWRAGIAVKLKNEGRPNPKCAVCGVSERERHRQVRQARESGQFVYLEDYPALLYCDKCSKFFCGAHQVDLGLNAGCPRCKTDLERPA